MPGPHPNPAMVNFRAHELNTGSEAGARADFEMMIAQLVDALHPGARRISPNPGDGGIDVFLGELDGQIIVWQAKYFLPQVVAGHRRQIMDSFASAQKKASTSGYQIDKWILCVPSSMDHPTTLWWDGWKRQRDKKSTHICRWDETGLRTRLAKPEAAAVLAAFYPPRREPPRPPPGAAFDLAVPVEQHFRGGETVRVAGQRCLLHGDPQEWRGEAWVLRTGAATVIMPPRPAAFRQLLIRRPGPDADAQAAAIDCQLRLLKRIGGRHGLPALIEGSVSPAEAAVITARPPGRTWREVFGPAGSAPARPLDRVTAVGLLTVAAQVADILARLHDAGHSHRALTPDGVVLAGPRGSAALCDIGLAAVPRRPGDGPAEYRAPEQERLGLHGSEVGFRTDVYRLAAMTYHCLTGRPPARGLPAPLRAFGFTVPNALDEVLLAALDPEPDRRPARLGPLASALRAGTEQLARSGR